MQLSEIPREASDRGIWWHIVGFALAGALCLVILEEFAGSDSRFYRYFATAVTDLYWALVIMLAGLIDRGRSMFETKMEIRRAARAKLREEERRKGRKEGRQEGRQEGKEETLRELAEILQRYAVRDEATGRVTIELPPELAAFLGDPAADRQG